MENNDLNVLDEVNKGATMGMDAIDFTLKKVGDIDFKKVLDAEFNKYKNISKRCNDIYSKYPTSKEPHETNTMNKAMTWWGIQMKTFTDQSNSNIAELLLNGTNMGIIEGRRLLNHNPNMDQDIRNVLNEFVTFQENNVEKLKTFL